MPSFLASQIMTVNILEMLNSCICRCKENAIESVLVNYIRSVTLSISPFIPLHNFGVFFFSDMVGGHIRNMENIFLGGFFSFFLSSASVLLDEQVLIIAARWWVMATDDVFTVQNIY